MFNSPSGCLFLLLVGCWVHKHFYPTGSVAKTSAADLQSGNKYLAIREGQAVPQAAVSAVSIPIITETFMFCGSEVTQNFFLFGNRPKKDDLYLPSPPTGKVLKLIQQLRSNWNVAPQNKEQLNPSTKQPTSFSMGPVLCNSCRTTTKATATSSTTHLSPALSHWAAAGDWQAVDTPNPRRQRAFEHEEAESNVSEKHLVRKSTSHSFLCLHTFMF